METEQKRKLSIKTKLIKWGVTAIAVIAVLAALTLTVYFTTRSDVKTEYEDIVAELRRQIEDMEQEPVLWEEQPTKEVSLSLIESQIKDIGELATIEYLYTDAGKFEDSKQMFGVNIPFATKSFIAKWDGAIKAGVKIDKITVEVNDAKKEIVVHMPAAEILSHEIDEKSIETLDEKDGLFNPVKVDDVRSFDAVSKDAMEKRAIENGILDKAYENAKAIIEKLVNTDVVQELEYTVRFEKLK